MYRLHVQIDYKLIRPKLHASHHIHHSFSTSNNYKTCFIFVLFSSVLFYLPMIRVSCLFHQYQSYRNFCTIYGIQTQHWIVCHEYRLPHQFHAIVPLMANSQRFPLVRSNPINRIFNIHTIAPSKRAARSYIAAMFSIKIEFTYSLFSAATATAADGVPCILTIIVTKKHYRCSVFSSFFHFRKCKLLR